MKDALRWVRVVAPVLVLALAFFVIHRELRDFHWRDIQHALESLRPWRVLLALAVTVAGYLSLTLYDVLALRAIRHPLPYRQIALASFVSYAVGNNVGLAVLSSGVVRYRLYSGFGLRPSEVAHVVFFVAVTFWVGLATLGGFSLLLSPPLPWFPSVARPLGLVLLAAVGVYLVLCARGARVVRLRRLTLELVPLRLALQQLAAGIADWSLAALVLHVLLPPESRLTFLGTLNLFILAQLAGLVSQVPGGIGVFESVVLASLTPLVPAPQVLGVLLVYRVCYYLLPFLAAALLFSAHEAVQQRAAVTRLAKQASAAVGPLVPTIAAVCSALGGTVLLLSGATPEVSARLEVLERWLPLPVLELSSFLGSLCGVGLWLLARALLRRLDAAYVLALVLLAAGIALSLLKGLDYEEALLLSALLLALLPFRKQFYRRASLFSERYSLGWLLSFGLVISAVASLSYFSMKHVEYSHELWWTFEAHAQAPRILRATVGVVTAALAFGVWQLLSPAPPSARLPTPEEIATAREIVARSDNPFGNLALVGDKTLLFNERHTAFIMYGVEGRSWVSMGDPIGEESEATELAWRFLELCDQHDGWTCFYEVSSQHLPRYLDLGLSLIKLGEEAVVPLAQFTLTGSAWRSLRHNLRRVSAEGCTFEVVMPSELAPLFPKLRAISDAWIEQKDAREMGFSVGFFDERYLSTGPVALVRLHDEPVAFANVWAQNPHGEISIDLMRHRPDTPHGVMDFLLVSLMLWGRAQGYPGFSLGMAPFSGLGEHGALEPFWSKLGGLLFRHGEHFYNFQGLREFKAKYRPVWRPRYLAAPGGLALPRVLASIATLVSRRA